jgi:hypothetical protein
MKLVVYNDSHVVAMRDRLYRPSYDHKKETELQYGQGIKADALSLGYDIPEKQLTNQLFRVFQRASASVHNCCQGRLMRS